MTPKVKHFGKWNSPISAEYVAKACVSYDDVLVDRLPSRMYPNGNAIYHIEKRPAEGGRNAIVDTLSKKDVLRNSWDARSIVHEYGGAGAIVRGGIVYFTNFKDTRVYRLDCNVEGAAPLSVTPENKNHRFADFAVHPVFAHIIVSILEDHTNPAPSDVANTLVVIDTESSSTQPLVSGADFYSSPTFNPNGTRLAWVQWNHPDMPWDGAQVFVADVSVAKKGESEKLEVKNASKIKGEWKKESAVRPQWVDANTLFFFCDESGFQNPWIIDLSASSPEPRPILPSPLHQDFSEPDWFLGWSSAAILTESSALVTSMRDGRSVLNHLDLKTGTVKELPSPYVVLRNIRRTGSRSAAFLGAKIDERLSVIHVILNEAGEATFTVLAGADTTSSVAKKIGRQFLSSPVPLGLKTRDGLPLNVIFYEPTNPNFIGPKGERPPCIVNVHGGPTTMADPGFKLRTQFFTSRGFAWVDINYGGSSGYGRQYRERLDGNWGKTDVNDCVDAVQALSSPSYGLISPSRVFISGGSGGGFTALQSLCTVASAVYTGGTSSFGFSNLCTLAEDTSKFVLKYMDKLLGGPVTHVAHVYRARSPIFHAENIKVPLLLLQGTEDRIVFPYHAEDMVRVIREHGGHVEYRFFKGEGHGWRRAETIIQALEVELGFYLKVMYQNVQVDKYLRSVL